MTRRCRSWRSGLVLRHSFAIRLPRRDADRASLHAFGYAVFHRILDHRLQNQSRHLRRKELLSNIDAEVEAIGEPSLLIVAAAIHAKRR